MTMPSCGKAAASTVRNRYLPLLLVILAAMAVLPRFAYLDVPFERDEGAYAYVADTISRGGLPYLDAFDHKPPMVYYIYSAAFRLFGHSIRAPRLMAALFIFFGCLLSCRIVLRATGSLYAGILTMFLLGTATASPAYTGFGSNAEIFMAPFLLGGFCLLLEEAASAYLPALSGLFFGIAFSIKPVAAPLAFAGVTVLLISRRGDFRKAALAALSFAAGCALPILLFAAYFLAKGAIGPFWEGLYKYNVGYAATVSWMEMFPMFLSSMKEIMAVDPVTWAAGIAGILLFFLRKEFPAKLPYFAFLAGGAAAVALPRYFYGHYYLVLIPFLIIGAGFGAGQFMGEKSRFAAGLVFLAVVLAAAGTQVKYFRMSSAALLQNQYGANPFYQSVGLAEYLKTGTRRDGMVYIIGSEAQVLDYSGLRSPGRIFYFYPLMIPSALRAAFRAETLSAIQRTPPEYVVFVNARTSHFIAALFDRDFLSRLFRLFSDYQLVALSPFGSSAVLEAAALSANLQLLNSPGAMLVFRRTDRRAAGYSLSFGKLFAL
jgi:hypothetical protein